MNRRLQQFLELEELTPSRLADILHIQRSGISHLLSGRNKPSYEFINSFIQKFPRVNAEWLITGKGKPYKDLETNSENNTETIDEDNTLFSFSNQPIIESNTISTTPIQENKKIKRITIFFSDGSFQEFLP